MRQSLLLATAVTAIALAAPARAQTFVNGTTAPMVLPSPGDADAGKAQAAPPRPALRHLPAHPEGLRLSGETAALDWPLVVTAAEARAGGVLRITVSSAVSVAPETSSLWVQLNGVPLGRVPISSGSGRLLTFDIPPGRLVPGPNSLRISANQRHRVDCSVAATYELWTQIDPDRTGFLPATDAGDPASLAELAAARPDRDGSVPIRVVIGGARMSPRETEQALQAVQGLALAGHFTHPVVDFGPPADGEGLNVAIGTRAQLGEALPARPAGAQIDLLPAAPGRRPTVLIATDGPGGLDETRGLAFPATDAGTAEGRAALTLAEGFHVQGGERVRLSDVGFASRDFDGRSLTLRFRLVLPSDFVPADYDKVLIDLTGAYIPGLDPSARMAVSVNDAEAASIPLLRAGDTFRSNRLQFQLGLLRPGVNRITITADVPRHADATCAAPVERRLQLLDSSFLTIPPIARAGRFPDLGQTADALARDSVTPRLQVPAPGRAAMGAVATLAARLALETGKVIPFAFSTGETAGTGPRVVIGPAPQLDPALISQAGVDSASLQTAWQNRPRQVADNDPLSIEIDRRRRAARDAIPACNSRRAPRLTVAEANRSGLASDRKTNAAPQTFGDRAANVLSVFAPASASADESRSLDHALLAVSQRFTGSGQTLTSLFTAADAEDLSDGIRCLTHPRVWGEMHGGLSLIDAAGTVHAVGAPVERWEMTQPFTPGNVRRSAAAWMSLHPAAYAAAIVVLAGLLGLGLRSLFQNLGRRSA